MSKQRSIASLQLRLGRFLDDGSKLSDHSAGYYGDSFYPATQPNHLSRNWMRSFGGRSQNCAFVLRYSARTNTARPRVCNARNAASSVWSSPRYATGVSAVHSVRISDTASPLCGCTTRSSIPPSNSNSLSSSWSMKGLKHWRASVEISSVSPGNSPRQCTATPPGLISVLSARPSARSRATASDSDAEVSGGILLRPYDPSADKCSMPCEPHISTARNGCSRGRKSAIDRPLTITTLVRPESRIFSSNGTTSG